MITIDDLAKLAHVSKSTISKALNDRPDVSAETRRKIREIAKAQNFTPNAYGKSLRSKITKNVGVIFTREKRPLLNNPFFSRILEGIEAELALNNYNLVLNIIPQNKVNELPRIIRERHVDGIILIGIFNDLFVERIIAEKIHVVQVDPKTDIADFSQVFIDNEHGAFIAVQYLIEAGHRRIGFIAGDLRRLSFKQRLDGYSKALKHYGIQPDDGLIRSGGVDDGYEHVKSLIQHEKPTAIFSANDLNALQGYNAVIDMNLKIPHDVSIVGFDDIWSAQVATPPLTTVRVYKEELGSIGVRTLLRTINGEIAKPVDTIVPVRLIERKSVRNMIVPDDEMIHSD
ncbi:MAG: LacI family transcriptional regulator [Calditrichaeota bacterium]|nr:LacI family transcriptional regulator [Calditrichota bacterium]